MHLQSFQFSSVDSFRDGGSSSLQTEAEENSEVLVEESVQKRIKSAVCVGENHEKLKQCSLKFREFSLMREDELENPEWSPGDDVDGDE